MTFNSMELPTNPREVMRAIARDTSQYDKYPVNVGTFPLLSALIPMMVFNRGKEMDVYLDLYAEFPTKYSTVNQDGGTLIISRIDDGIDPDFALPGFERVPDLELFARQNAGLESLTVLYSPTKRATIVAGTHWQRRTYEKIDTFIASLLPRFCPWLAESAQLTDAERALLGAVHAGDKTAVKDTLMGFYNSSEFTEWWNNTETAMAVQQFAENRINAVRNIVDDLYRQIEDYKARLRKLSEDVHNYELQMTDLKRSNEGFAPLKDAIKAFKDKIKIRMSRESLSFLVRSDLNNIDSVYAANIMRNCDYRAWAYNSQMELAERALTEVLSSNEKYKLQMYSIFELPEMNDVTAFYSFSGMEGPFVENRIANPHHSHYHCIGSYHMDLVELMKEGNFFEFFMTMIESAGSINEREGVTMEGFIRDLASNMNILKCVRDTETGELLTLQEVLDRKEAQQVETDKRDAE